MKQPVHGRLLGAAVTAILFCLVPGIALAQAAKPAPAPEPTPVPPPPLEPAALGTHQGDERSLEERRQLHVPLTAKLQEKMRAFHGEIGLYAKDLNTGEIVSINADQRFPTASLIKVAVMAEVFRQIDAGKLRHDTTVTLKESDKAGDETVPLNMLHPGVVLSVDDLLRFMIAYSDNTATNLLVGLVGTANVDALLDSYGLTKTRLYRPTFRDGHADVLPGEEKEFGLGSTTPHEIARLVELIAQGKIVSAAAGDAMIALLATQQDRAMIPRSLPFGSEEILVANKTGWDEEKNPDAKGFKGDVRNDAAYVKTPRTRYVIAICARRIQDKSSGVDNETLRLGAELSRMVYDAFSQPRAKELTISSREAPPSSGAGSGAASPRPLARC